MPTPQAVTMKRKQVGKTAPEGGYVHLAPMESRTFLDLANVVAHLAVCKYDDGQPRQPGTMLIKTVGASWCVVLKDPDGMCQMQLLGNTLDDALAMADLHLGSDTAPWEIDPWARQKGGKKGGK